MFLSINIVRAIVEELLRQGLTMEAICARAAIDPVELADAAHRLPFERGTHVVASALEMTPAPEIGLRVGESAPLKALHVVGHLLASSATMREAVQLFLRYSTLVWEGGHFSLAEDGQVARFVYEHPLPGAKLERFAAEVSLTVVLRLWLQITGPDTRPIELRFRHADPGYTEEYERIFRCPVRFSQPVNELVFDRSLLDLPQLHRDELLCELLREQADRLLAHTSQAEHLAERIIEAL